MRIPNRRSVAATALTTTMLAVTACGTGGADAGSALSLVGFSTPKVADNALEKAFAATPDGKGVQFKESYGASGDQSRAVAGGLKADVVHFSLEPDVTKLVDKGLVDKGWKSGPTKGIVSSSVVTLAVRKGNPKHIKGWDDLTKPGVKIVTPNPGSSGSAKWNILAAYGHIKAAGGSDAKAKAYLTKFFKNVAALPSSGRDATTAFTAGTGDVLVTYEDEAILARQKGEDFDYVVPKQTLRIDNPGAVTKSAKPAAKKFLSFAESKAGQEIFAAKGFRPVGPDASKVKVQVKGSNDPSNPFPKPAKLQTIDGDFGGWAAADKKFFDEKKGIVPKIQQATDKK